MDKTMLIFLRALKESLCPDGMIALQIGGIGDLPETKDGESRIVFVSDSAYQYVTLTDDEFDNSEKLVMEIVDLICEQRDEEE